MKKTTIAALILVPLLSLGQGITFEVEKLSKPEKRLRLQSYDEIYDELILKDANLSKRELIENGIDFKYNIIAKSEAADSLVNFGFNSFFNGMYEAYAQHRPFVLSPDMVWLLISQGFARHVHANPEKLRKHFVNFSDKLSLVVKSESDLLTDSTNWEDVFPQFTSQIAEHTGEELINTLSSDFSTSTTIEKIASEMTIMEAMEPYFEYVVIYTVCGIPEVTLQGTTEDWQKVLDKTRKLSDYDLKWWTKKLEPILNEFIHASKGNIDKKFWRNMFKYHSQKQYGAPNIIDGWIVKFFPYDKDGKRNNLKKLVGGGSLPEEIVKVDLTYIKTNGSQTEETMLELWAGFIGLEQNPETYALTPQISWMVKKKDVDKIEQQQKLESDNVPCVYLDCGIDLRILEVPEMLKKLDEIYSLSLHFKENVNIPDWLKEIRIGRLIIKGKLSRSERKKMIDWFPNTDLVLNDKEYNSGRNGLIAVYDEISEDLKDLKDIWVLEIWHINNDHELIIPDWIKNIAIENLSLVDKTSTDTIEKIKTLLPDTKLYVSGERIE